MPDVAVNESLSYAPDPTGMYAVVARLAERLNVVEAQLEETRRREVSPTATAATANTVVLRDGSGNATVAGVTATTVAANSNMTVGGTLSVTGVATLSAAPLITNTNPGILFYESDQSANERYWDWRIEGKTLLFRVINDALNSATTAFSIVRGVANAISSIALNANTAITGTLSATEGIKSRGSGGGTAAFSLDITDNANQFTVANNATQDLFGSNAFGGAFILHDAATDGKGVLVVAMGNRVDLLGDPLYTTTLTTASKLNIAISGGKLVLENKSGGSRTFAMLSLRTRTTQ